jgi:hypothetical protein
LCPAEAAAEPTEDQVALARAGRDSDRLQQLRAVLPCEVRVVRGRIRCLGGLLIKLEDRLARKAPPNR